MIRDASAAASIPETVVSSAGDAELAEFVAQSLGARPGEGFELVRRPLQPATSFPCEVLTVRSGSERLELFFKDYGACRLPRDEDGGPAREVAAYRSLLDPAALGTPRHVGSRLAQENDERRAWLLLEHVAAPSLSKRDLAPWHAAARWLATLQARPAPTGPAREALAVHDALFYQRTARAGARAVAAVDLLLERELQNALEGHEARLERLADWPLALVHGSFRADNVLYVAASGRVAPIDWEHAALGHPLHDVVMLSANLGRADADSLLAAFAAAAEERGLALPPADEWNALAAILRLHKHLRSLARAIAWAYPRETVAKLVALCVEVAREADERPSPRRGRVLHPALRAYRALGREPERDADVECLQGRFFSRRSRVVYRLGPIGPGGMPLVAKRCYAPKIEQERVFYEDVLPRVEIRRAACLGSLADDGSTWLFLEDVGGQRLVTASAEERRAGLVWIAELNLASRGFARTESLPDRGPGGYLDALREAHAALVAGRSNPALDAAGLALVDAVAATCERALSGWPLVQEACAEMPATIVHGDYRPKNLFLRERAGARELVPIDWEYSGWGVPAVDLGSLLREHGEPADLAAYRDALDLSQPLEALWRWVLAGRAMRAIASIHWLRTAFAYPFLDKPVRNLRGYGDALARAFDGLERRTRP